MKAQNRHSHHSYGLVTHTAKSAITGGDQRRKIVLDNLPEPHLADVVILVTKAISKRTDIPPWLIRDE